MFATPLGRQPRLVLLAVFTVIWVACAMAGTLLVQWYLRQATGLPAKQLGPFMQVGMFKQPHLVFAVNALSQIFTFLLPAVLCAVALSKKPMVFLGGGKPLHPSQAMVVACVAASLIFLVSSLGTMLKQVDWGSASRAMDKQRDAFIQAYLSSTGGWPLARDILLMAVLPAICEEFFFRALLMKVLRTFARRWWLSVGLSALVFASLHNTVSEFVPIFLAGLVLGRVYWLTGNIWMSVLLHLLFNGTQVAMAILMKDSGEGSPNNIWLLSGIGIVSAMALLAFMRLLYRKRTPLPDYWGLEPYFSPENMQQLDILK
ncbi:MAG: CPBP family intramembrane metalloprotease [Edaphocola sp.]